MSNLLTPHDVSAAHDTADRLGEIVNPWRHAQDLGVDVVHADLEEGVWGLSTGRTVWLDTGLSAVELRATLAHECSHLELGHESPQSERVEAFVDLVTALRLVRPSRSRSRSQGLLRRPERRPGRRDGPATSTWTR